MDGGAPEPVIATTRRAVSPVPSPDGRFLVFAANPDSVDAESVATGSCQRSESAADIRCRRVPRPRHLRRRPAAGRDSECTTSGNRASCYPIQPPGRLQPITDGYTGDIDPCWSPDGTRLVFSSTSSGHRNIWWARADLSKPVFLTKEASIDEGPVYSPDGTQVAFVSDRGGRRGIWAVSADGGTPRLITPAHALNAVSWSRDGKRLAYSAPVGALPQIEIVEVSTGKVSRLPTTLAANSPAWSPVEDVIAYLETSPGIGAFVRFMTGDGKPLSRGPARFGDPPQ